MQQLPFFIRDIRYYIQEDFENYHSFESMPERIVKSFKELYIAANDEKLLNFIFIKNPTQDDLDKFLSEWDLEEQSDQRALILAYFMKKHPELNYPKYIGPRLLGILKFFKYKNLIKMSHFKKICTAIKKKNVDIMVMKGAAFRHINPDFPRIMGDMDILVHDEDYKTAVDTALNFGYSYYAFEHSIDIMSPEVGFLLDIHRKLCLRTGADESISEDLFSRAHPEKVFNVDNIYVPCPEDMMFILLASLTKNLSQHSCGHNILHYITDSMFLINLKPDFDWDIVKQNVIKTKTELSIVIAAKFLNLFVSEKLPEMFVDEFCEKSHLYMGSFLGNTK